MADGSAARVRVPSQDRAVRTRAALLRAAQHEFSTRGYAATTAKTIAARADVATGSFYQYFVSKDALLRELAQQRQTELTERTLALLEAAPPADARSLPALARARMGEVVQLVIDAHREDPGLHAVLTERRHADPELDALTRSGEHTLVDRTARLLQRWGTPGDRRATAFVLFGMLEGSVHAHVLGEPAVDDARFVAALVDALLRVALPTLAIAAPTRSRGRAVARRS